MSQVQVEIIYDSLIAVLPNLNQGNSGKGNILFRLNYNFEVIYKPS